MKAWLIAVSCAGLLAAAGSANAAGCLKGAAVGGVAGHHAIAGAVVGCAIGHHQAAKKAREEKAAHDAANHPHA